MANTVNSVQVESLPQLRAEFVQPQHLAVGIQLSKLQYLAQVMGDENAPHFRQGNEPLQDGIAYQAKDGNYFYRPQLRVAQRSSGLPGPNVCFIKDQLGKVRLQFELEEVPLTEAPAGAEPFNTKVTQVILQWSEAGQLRQRLFDQPTLVGSNNPQDSTQSNFSIRVGAELTPEEVQPTYLALSKLEAQAKLNVTLSFSYWVDEQVVRPGPPIFVPREETEIRPNPREVAERIRPSLRDIAVQPSVRSPQIINSIRVVPFSADLRRVSVQPEAVNVAAIVSADAAAPAAMQNVSAIAANQNISSISAALRARDVNYQLRPEVSRVAIAEILRKGKQRELEPNFRSITITRTIPFSFDPALQQHRLIYSAIREDDTLTEIWTDTEFGPIRKALFTNTIYRLPDELRLVYNSELGRPHMIPTCYRDRTTNEIRVRVTLRAVPWFDPHKLVRLRDYLYRASGGTLAASQVVVGGYKEAKLKLITQFPEEIRALMGDNVAISLEGASDLILDLSLEYYRFLCELLVGPVGLSGEVTVTLDVTPAEGGQPQEQVRRLPLRLTLDDLSTLPTDVQIAQDAVSPRQVQLINKAQSEMRINGCEPRLLQYDGNSVVPIAVFKASSTTAFPASLAPGAALSIDIQPEDQFKEQIWNAVQLEVLGQELMQPATQVLDRIHEVVSPGELSWKIHAECPLFQRELPEQFQNLYRLEVQILRPGFVPQQVILSKEQPQVQVNLQRTLQDIFKDDANSVPAFSYRVRNIYFTHEGQWSGEKPATGSIFVFPNPAESG